MSSMRPRSNATKCSAPGPDRFTSSIAWASSSLILRAIAMTQYPHSASLRAMPSPRPRLPPVTTILRMVAHQLAGLGDVEGRHEADRGRHLVLGKIGAARLHDLAFELGGAVRGCLAGRRRAQQDIRHDNLAGDRIAARTNKRH